jgi:SPFH domain / Band 7 family
MTVAVVTLPLSGKRGPYRTSHDGRANIVATAMFVVPVVIGVGVTLSTDNPWPIVLGVLIGFTLMQSPKVAKQWERAVVLRLGRYVGLRGPGLFWIVPFVDSVTRWIDQRVITTSFAAEQTLTSDTVPVNVDAVLFWLVYDAEKAALEVQEYQQAVSWAAQTALRRSAEGTRADRRGASEADRPAVESVGRDRAVGRNARRGHSRIIAGRDVA